MTDAHDWVLRELLARRDRLHRQMKLLDEAVTALEEERRLAGESAQAPAPPPASVAPPGTKRGVLMVVTEASRPLTDVEITAEFAEREWQVGSAIPLNAVRASLSKLVRSGDLVRYRSGGYDVPGRFEDLGVGLDLEPF